MNTRRYLGILRKREVIGGLIAFLLWQIVFPLLAALLAVWLGFREDTPERTVWLHFGTQTATAVVVLVVFRRFLSEQFARAKACGSGFWKHVGLGLAVWYGLSYAATLLLNFLIGAFGLEFENANNELVLDSLRAVPVPMFVSVVLLAPIVEECFLRGLLFCPLAKRSRVLAYAVSALAFASLHLIAGIGTVSAPVLLLTILQYVPSALALAWVYDRSGTIWASVFLHALINLIALLLNLFI